MDTQNTPVHIKLWHKDFWRLCFANLLLMSSVYMLVFAIPYFLLQEKFQMWQIGCVLLAYGFGLFCLAASALIWCSATAGIWSASFPF